MTEQIAGLEKEQKHANNLVFHFPALRFGVSFSSPANSAPPSHHVAF